MEPQRNNFHGYTPVSSGSRIHLERPRIHRLIEKAAQKPVISVVAGAGYGKTCAVYQYANNKNIRTAWMQISERDNLGERFWENYVSAISIINTEFAKKLQKMNFPASGQQFERFLGVLKQAVFSNENYLLVLDDVHLITDPVVLRFLENILSISFPNLISVLISRTEPAIDIKKLDKKKLLARIPEHELRFSMDEMLAYFNLYNLSLSPGIASAIFNDTEGWAFAIHLALLTFRSSSGSSYVPQALKTNISKLIETEIMSGLSADLQCFLIKLSLIENHNRELIRIIADNHTLLEEMQGIQSVIDSDSNRNSYHIHHLFNEYLRDRQRELSSDEKKEVWIRSASWCAANNRKMDAIIYYEKAEEYNSVFEIFNTLPLLLSTQTARFILEILDRAPAVIYRDNLKIIVMRNRVLASLSLLEQSRKETLENLPRYNAMPESTEKHLFLLVCYVNLASIGFVGSVNTRNYDFVDYFKTAVIEAQKSGHITKPPLNGDILSSYVCRVKSPASGKDIENYIQMLGVIVPFSVQAMGGCRHGLYELALGEFCFFRGELKEAEKHFFKSLEKSREQYQFEIQNRAFFYLLRINLSQGDKIKIEKILAQLELELNEPLFPNRFSYYDIVTGWYNIQTGQKDRVAGWIKSVYEESELVSVTQGLEKLVKAKYYFSEKRYSAALALLDNMENTEPLLFGDVEMKALEAVCLYRQAGKEEAFAALGNAHRLAKPAGITMPFTELGKDMRTLVEAAIKSRTEDIPAEWLLDIRRNAAEYAKKIYPFNRQLKQNNSSLLSSREREILTGLSQGLTREEIARTASISPNTVKAIIRSIYNKLGAYNQAEAVRIAAERGIL